MVNSLIILLLGEPLAILLASNLAYMLAITLAVAGFLLLRKDRPDWPRPIRRGRGWIPTAWALLAFDTTVVLIGATHPGLAGYGGLRETFVGLAILLISIALYSYRRLIQDRQKITWRIEPPRTPEIISTPPARVHALSYGGTTQDPAAPASPRETPSRDEGGGRPGDWPH